LKNKNKNMPHKNTQIKESTMKKDGLNKTAIENIGP
jgi:hypothetical protein